jgi:GNAT superfamily N-acetyltransferase
LFIKSELSKKIEEIGTMKLNIRLATKPDFEEIESWLKKEYKSGQGGFYSNINLIKDGQKEGTLTVAVCESNNLPIAFYLGSKCMAEILEVKHDYRKKGIGKLLMKYILERAKKEGCIGVSGFCSPKESLPFWLSIGFERVTNPNESYQVAYPLRRRHKLPMKITRCDIVFKLYEDDTDSKLLKTQKISAAQCNQNYRLEEDFVEYVFSSDTLLVIGVGDSELYNDKIKHIDTIGGERDNTWVRVRQILR